MPNKENPELRQWVQEQQAQDKANQQATSYAKISEKEALEFLHKSGAVASFEEVARTLKEKYDDVTLTLEYQKQRIALYWDFSFCPWGISRHIYDLSEPPPDSDDYAAIDNHNDPSRWSYQAIRCAVVKNNQGAYQLELRYTGFNQKYWDLPYGPRYSTYPWALLKIPITKPEELGSKIKSVITFVQNVEGVQEPINLSKRFRAWLVSAHLMRP